MLLDSFRKSIPFLLITGIVILAWVFHYPVHFEDALSRTIANGYGVHINPWRIVFEPFLGPLLFLNRSLYALDEILWTFIWFLIGFILFHGYLILCKGKPFKKAIGPFLLSFLLVIGCCSGLFAVLLFAPLPNNVIENRTDRILVATHAHTEYSHDGLISQLAMFEWHRYNRFDAFFITDHAHCQRTSQFVAAQRNGEFSMYPLVMPGQEYSASNHLSLLGLDGCPFDTKGMDDRTVIDTVHGMGGIVLVNHWFDGKGKDKTVYRDLGVDGFEIENTGAELYYDRELFKTLLLFCQDNGLTMVGGLDFHGYGRVCSVYNALEIPDWYFMEPDARQNAIIEVLRNGPQNKIQILLYKDRPFYAKANLAFRPFLTVPGYFRTLNGFQVASWSLWILLFWWAMNKRVRPRFLSKNGWPFLALGLGGYLVILGYRYYVKAAKLAGDPANQNDIYDEYSGIILPMGVVVAIFALGILIWSWIRRNKEMG